MRGSPLSAELMSAGARFISRQGWEIAADFGSVEREYWMLKKGAGLFDISHRGRILVRGEDAPRFLHGMVTNDVQGLNAGEGNYAFLLNVHGHILADAHILRLNEQSFLLDCEPQSSEVVMQALDRHIIADAVELEDQREQLAGIGVEGPRSRELVERAIKLQLPEMKPFDHVYQPESGARIVRVSIARAQGYWIFAPTEAARQLWNRIVSATGNHADPGAAIGPVGFGALEICRIEAGIPRYGIDITEKNLPQETGQMQAISFNKGCYVGQEVVERIRSRGHVNRQFVRLLAAAQHAIAPETGIIISGQEVGYTCSCAYSPSLNKTVVLGYMRQEHAQAGAPVLIQTVVFEPAPVASRP